MPPSDSRDIKDLAPSIELLLLVHDHVFGGVHVLLVETLDVQVDIVITSQERCMFCSSRPLISKLTLSTCLASLVVHLHRLLLLEVCHQA